MARVTKHELEQQIAKLTTELEALRSENSKLKVQLQAGKPSVATGNFKALLVQLKAAPRGSKLVGGKVILP